MKRADVEMPLTSKAASIHRVADDAGTAVGPRALSGETRFAIYLTPSGLWRTVGNLWLGRDAERDRMLPRDWLAALPNTVPDAETGGNAAQTVPSASSIDEWTADPRRYGLHATLKPPFRLASGQTPGALDSALRSLAGKTRPFDLPLRLDALRGFLAWQAADERVARGPLQSLADTCVRELDPFRAPRTEQEHARRLKKAAGEPHRYSDREQAHLARWAYPYVFDTFHFHITLTNRLDAATAQCARGVLAALAMRVTARDAETERAAVLKTAPLADAMVSGGSMPVRDIALFMQPGPDLPFVVVRHYGFDGSIRDGVGVWALCD